MTTPPFNPSLPTLRLHDTAGQALAWMEEYRIPQLVVAEEGQYVGILSEEMLMDRPDEALIAECEPQHPDVLAYEGQHLLEWLRLVQRHQLEVLAVASTERHLLGCVSTRELYTQLAESLGTDEEGAIVVLELDDRDYSLTEISRLVESNGVKIISSTFVSPHYETERPGLLTLKLNRRDVKAVVATLERYDYTLHGLYAAEEADTTDRERLDQLLRYLEM